MGLFTSVVVYPFLHELGHSLAAALFGGEVVEFRLLPSPCILCDATDIDNIGLAVVGLCGAAVPFFISLPFKFRNFTLWYMLQLIKGISALAFLISLVSLAGEDFGFLVKNDDILKVIKYCPEGEGIYRLLLIAGLLASIFSICSQRPLKRIYGYFGIK